MVTFHVQHERSQCDAPPTLCATTPRRVERLRMAAGLDEIAHLLPNDPAVSRKECSGAVEARGESLPQGRDGGRLFGTGGTLLVVPVTEATEANVASPCRTAVRDGEASSSVSLELELRTTRLPVQTH